VAKIFKRKALGFFGFQSIKTLDEMAQLLYNAGVVSSLDEGKEITPLIKDGSVIYGSFLFKELDFATLKDGKGNTKYKISVYSYDPM